MIKVVHICEGFVGGMRTHLCAILPELVGKGLDVTLVVSLGRSAPDVGARITELRGRGVKVCFIPMLRGIHPPADARALLAILRLLSRQRFDAVHTHGSKAGALGRVAAMLAGTPIRLHSPHCFAFLRTRSRAGRLVYLQLERILGLLTTCLIAVAPSEADIAVRHHIVPRGKCRVVKNAPANGSVFNGQSTSDGRREGSSTSRLHRRVVTTVCRLVDYKGVFRFLRAAQLSRVPGVRFLVAGDGELRSAAQSFVVHHRLRHKVRLLGHVANMGPVYARSDVVVLCSDGEAAPYCLLEAMRARCAIVATAVIGNRELVIHNATGLLVEPAPAPIARAIDELLASESKRRELTDNAYAYVRAHHDLERQVSDLSDIYRTLCWGEHHCVRHRP